MKKLNQVCWPPKEKYSSNLKVFSRMLKRQKSKETFNSNTMSNECEFEDPEFFVPQHERICRERVRGWHHTRTRVHKIQSKMSVKNADFPFAVSFSGKSRQSPVPIFMSVPFSHSVQGGSKEFPLLFRFSSVDVTRPRIPLFSETKSP